MSILVPFKAFRPIEDKVKEIASRPYDVLNSKEAREICKDNPNSFYRVIKPELEFADDADHYAPEVYKKGKENFDRLVNGGLMVQDETENYYAYQIVMNGHKQTKV